MLAVAVHGGPADNPGALIWSSGEELMTAGRTWEIDAPTPAFDGEVSVQLADRDENGGVVRSFGWVTISAAAVATSEADVALARFALGGAHYTLSYSLVEAEPHAVVDVDTDPDLETDLGMLKNGSKTPLERRLGVIASSANETVSFRREVLRLATLCREAVKRYERERLEYFLQHGTATDAKKTAEATRLCRDVARMEFLLGWMYQKGYSGSRSWEVTQNRGVFPDVYLSALGNEMQAAGDRMWCTAFNGVAYRWLGFDIVNASNETAENRVFWSGYRLELWARSGRGLGAGNAIIGDPISTARGGCVHSVKRQSSWTADAASLPGSLVTWRQLWDELSGAGKTPQPGDIVLLKNFGHTVMIDDVEASGDAFYVYTVEGNAANAVRSRRIDMRAETGALAYQDKKRRCLASESGRCVMPPEGTAGDQIRTETQRRFGVALVRPSWENFAEEMPATALVHVASDDAQQGASNVIGFRNVAPPGELLALMLKELKTFMSSADRPNGPWIRNPDGNKVWDWCGRPTAEVSIT